MLGDGERGGRLVVRAKDGSEQSIQFDTPPSDMFMRWKDDGHLELWTERQPLHLQTERLGEVDLIARSYKIPRKPAYDDPGNHTVAVPAEHVVGTFARQTHSRGRSCVLTLGTAHHPSFDRASVEITANINPTCNKPHPCMSIATRFTLEGVHKQGRQSTLTSATVSDIPSYNRLPTGGGGTSVRGQFLGQNAENLIEEIAKPSVILNFSRDFFGQVIRYALPLSEVAAPVAGFRRCTEHLRE